MTRRRALWLMVVCLLAAAALRLPSLTDMPPGLHYDEAANAILAGNIGLRGERPLFITSYTGKEVLFFYLAGTVMAFVGESVLALRLTAAFVGLLTVAATYWLGRELLADRRVAVLVAALLAVSFWHIMFSRLGFRAVTQPLLQALTVAALFRGLKRGQLAWIAIGGALFGLTAYTYLAARIFPIVVLVALLPLLFQRDQWKVRWRQLAPFLLTALLVAGPLLLFFVQHPEAFWVRVSQVAPDSGAGELLDSYLRSLGMFFLVGDPYWRFNIPDLPLFSWWWGGLLVVGWFVAIWRWRRDWYDWQKAAVLLLLLVPFVMILPTALATGEILPSNLRAIGLIPFVFFLPALGLVALLEQLANIIRRPDSSLTGFLRYLNILESYEINYAFVILLVVLLGGFATWRTYFQEWAGRSDLFYDSAADLVAVAEYLDVRPPDGTLYVGSRHYRHPTLAFLSDQYERIKWLPDSQVLVLPASGSATYVFPRTSPLPAWAEGLLTAAEGSEGQLGPDGEPVFTVYRANGPVRSEITNSRGGDSLPANFGNTIELTNYSVSTGISGQTLPLILAWEVTGIPVHGYRPFVHLEDQWGKRWAQSEPIGYPSEQWAVGERIIQEVALAIPRGTPPGYYRARVGFFDPDSGERLPRLDEEGRYAGDSVSLEELPLNSGPLPVERPVAPRGVPQEVAPGLALLGYDRGGDSVESGAHLPLSLWWWATAAQPDLLVRLELLGQDNHGIRLLDTKPVQGSYPMDTWPDEIFLIDEVSPQIPPDIEGGDYRLHLRLLAEDGTSVFTSSLGPLTVVATPRTFEIPTVANPLAATFKDEIELVGYDMEPIEHGSFRLRLVWRALTVPADDYTVFVHLLAEDGTCCLWQDDVMPLQGTYPTSRWLPDEVVEDTYEVRLPPETGPGVYPIEVGLYLAETGQRLPVTVPGLETDDVVLLEPLRLSQ